eukprot:m.683855 g.683855  ORF g.683855 m.683855 type:complete len:172 (+) comp22831_c0_seq7:2090-2605(+)
MRECMRIAAQAKTQQNTVLGARVMGTPPPTCTAKVMRYKAERSHVDLGPCECEITVQRCEGLPLPAGWKESDLNVYVTYTFPYPNKDEPQCGKTQCVRGTGSPQFDASTTFDFKSRRTFARMIPRRLCRMGFRVMLRRGSACRSCFFPDWFPLCLSGNLAPSVVTSSLGHT